MAPTLAPSNDEIVVHLRHSQVHQVANVFSEEFELLDSHGLSWDMRIRRLRKVQGTCWMMHSRAAIVGWQCATITSFKYSVFQTCQNYQFQEDTVCHLSNLTSMNQCCCQPFFTSNMNMLCFYGIINGVYRPMSIDKC